ncbi:hypothetical protein [Streptomyces sp. NPDC014793]|uniref:hypothetical protein n=1 Tax=Streptomyces sp. NPDC014793 TaxID=3364914 RepID=UPI0036F59820
MTDKTDRDVSWSVVFRLNDNDDWHDWTRNHRDVSDAVKSAEALVKTPPVVQIRFDRITVQRERFSLAELSAADDPAAAPAGPAPATDPDTLRERIAEALSDARRNGLGGMTEAQAVAHMADAVLRRLAGEAQQNPCGRTESVTGEEYPPCARLAGHREAYCRSADGKAYFLALYGPRPAREAQQDEAPRVCTCGNAGVTLLPPGHYGDCPEYPRQARQDPAPGGEASRG